MNISTSSSPGLVLYLSVLLGAVVGRYGLRSPVSAVAERHLFALRDGASLDGGVAYELVDWCVAKLGLGRDTEAPLSQLACGLWVRLEELAEC